MNNESQLQLLQKFLEKFKSRIEKQQILDETALDDKSASVLATDVSVASTILDQSNNKGAEFWRNQKLLRKDHIESIKSFLSTKTYLNFTSKIQYIQIIIEFLEFSPECDIDDYLGFMKFKSTSLSFPKMNESVIEGTLIKYSNVIKQYIFYVKLIAYTFEMR